MKKILLTTLLTFSLALGAAFLIAGPVGAADVFENCSDPAMSDSVVCSGGNDELFGPGSIFLRIINILIFVVGILAVLMLIIGGMRYTLSAGDSNAVNGAKNTILYSIIGVVVAVAAYAIVNFVIVRLL